MKRISQCWALLGIVLFLSSCSNYEHALISTDYGDIKIYLYESTPQHKANFIKLVKEGFYDDLLFHRVVPDFMIQGGDPQSKGAAPGTVLGSGGPGYTIPQEIGAPHIRGAVAAARQPDNVNPSKESSGSQFYIVQGRPVSEAQLNQIAQRKGFNYNETQKKLYLEKGGRIDLDGGYTIFGEVVSGMEVVDQIAGLPRDRNNRPKQDVKMTIKLVR